MKVEKAREKDGKLELLVELSVAETEEELQQPLCLVRKAFRWERVL